MPVFHTSFGQRNGLFGVSFFVLLSPTEASSQESIYRAVVERCERWTKNRRHLWRYCGQKLPSATIDDELEEIVANIEPEVIESEAVVTEIRPGAGGEGGREELKVEVVPDVPDVEMSGSRDAEVRRGRAWD